MNSDARLSHLYPGEHACSGHTEVQISNHLRCGRLINLRRPTARKVICKPGQLVQFSSFNTEELKLFTSTCISTCQLLVSNTDETLKYGLVVVKLQEAPNQKVHQAVICLQSLPTEQEQLQQCRKTFHFLFDCHNKRFTRNCALDKQTMTC